MAEMEWEFSEGGESDGQFMATGKVINFLRGHLARGEIDAAVSLYESCVQDVGETLWGEFQAASVPMKKAIANLFFRSRDYARSAAACEKLGEWIAAGRSHEAAYEYSRAAACYIKASDKPRAAAVYEKSGDYRKAAELYYEANDLDSAAAALEKTGDTIGAAQLFIQRNDLRRAAQLLAQVQATDARYLHAVGLLSDVLVRMNRRDLAIQRLALAVPRGAPIRDSYTAELAYRLGKLLWEQGQNDQARQAFEQVAALNPGHKDVAACLAELSKGQGGIPAPQLTNPFLPKPAITVTGRPAQGAAGAPTAPATSTAIGAQAAAGLSLGAQPGGPVAMTSDPFAALDGNPFAPKKDKDAAMNVTMPMQAIRGQPSPDGLPAGLVTRMEGYEVLKKLPIFEDLSLDEMKAFYNICDQVFFEKGATVIEQGRPGEGLVIVREGSLAVSKLDAGREIPLATIPAGNYVGEMSLIDDAPTSARVTAAENVKALRIRRDRFEHFLFANDRIALRVYKQFLRTITNRLRETNAQMATKR
ncbi:cyclic nucleotide-binding domain-containing protein [Myxococcota bacterium]|nr:cyclic nucleotide-binding domain-containing protein [Myxococcota bacterium]